MKKLLVWVMAAVMGFSLAGCSSKEAEKGTEPSSVQSQGETAASGTEAVEKTGSGASGELVVATWAGSYQELLQEYLEPVLAEIAPDVTVVYATGNDTDHIAKALAEKGGKGTYDVMMIGQLDMPKMKNNDLVMKLEPEKIPNMQYINPEYVDDYFIPQISSGGVLAYNENHVEKPDSWSVFWDEQYKGKIGILETSRMFSLYMCSLMLGPDVAYGGDWNQGWDGLMKMKEEMDIKVYATNEQLGNAMATGEIWITFGWRARASSWDTEEGEPVGNVVPKEGTYPYLSGACIFKNANNPEAANAFMNALLDPRVQLAFAENMGYAPTVTNCTLPEELDARIGFTQDELSRIKPVDADYIFENDGEWLEKWNKEFIAE